MIQVRIGTELHTWAFEEWEDRVREGRVPPNALVRFPAVTGDAFVPAGDLQIYRSLRDRPSILAVAGPPIVTVLLVGFQLRVWWWSRVGWIRDEAIQRFTSFAPPIFEGGEVWRLLSMGVLHVALLHVATNLLWLAYVGVNLERVLGRAQLLLLYAVSVLVGASFSVFGSPDAFSLGASGGVFGLVAGAVTFGVVRADPAERRLARGFGLVLLPYLLLMFRSGLVSEGVDNWCHFGGMVAGGLLGLVLDPPGRERLPGWNRGLGLAVGLASLAWLVVVAAFGPRLQPLADADRARARANDTEAPAEARRELVWAVPGGWKPGKDLSGRSAWCSLTSEACVSARTTVEAGPASADALLSAASARLGEDWPRARFEAPVDATVGGWPARRVDGTVERAGEPVSFSWWVATRGSHSVQVVYEVPVRRASRLGPLRDRLLERVVWSDPQALVDARTAFEERGTSASRETLAAALAEVGEVEQALALHEALLAPGVDDPDRWAALLATLRVAGPSAVNAPVWWERALGGTLTPTVLVALADAMEAGGEPWSAVGLLTLAWDRTPGDRTIGRARRARGLSRGLDPDGRPWDLARDPVTRLPRDPASAAARSGATFSLGSIRATGAAVRAERERLSAAALRHLVAEDPVVFDDLVVLSVADLDPATLEDARIAAARDLLAAVDGAPGASAWIDGALLEGARAHARWLGSHLPPEPPDAAPASAP